MQINITDFWGKCVKMCVKIYVEYFKKFHDQKIDFCNTFKKLNTLTEDDSKSLCCSKETFQNVTFFCNNPKNVIEE